METVNREGAEKMMEDTEKKKPKDENEVVILNEMFERFFNVQSIFFLSLDRLGRMLSTGISYDLSNYCKKITKSTEYDTYFEIKKKIFEDYGNKKAEELRKTFLPISEDLTDEERETEERARDLQVEQMKRGLVVQVEDLKELSELLKKESGLVVRKFQVKKTDIKVYPLPDNPNEEQLKLYNQNLFKRDFDALDWIIEFTGEWPEEKKKAKK